MTTETLVKKEVLGIYQPGSTHMVGDGFPVRNLFPSNELDREVDPFLMLDYAGPQFFSSTEHPRGVGEHPHRGFETVTIVYEGIVAHRDSAGNAGVIGPGDVQWMTAASGVVHEELHERNWAKKGGTQQMRDPFVMRDVAVRDGSGTPGWLMYYSAVDSVSGRRSRAQPMVGTQTGCTHASHPNTPDPGGTFLVMTEPAAT